MITKITRGSRVGDIAAYLHGPGKRNEHFLEDGRTPGGEVIASNIGANGDRDPAFWASQLREAHKQRPDIGKPIWQCSIRAAETDRVMDATEWAAIAQEFAEGMGFADYPWVAVKHGPDHIHVVVSRVHEDPAEPVWLGRNDRWAAQQVRRSIEASRGLYEAPTKSTATTKRVADHQLKGGEWRHAQSTGEAPVRVRLAVVVASVAAQSRGLGREAFEQALAAQGVIARANVASTGRMNGYSFAEQDAVTDRDGELIWFKASQLDKELSWATLGPLLETPREPLPDRPSPGRTLLGREKHWESPAHRDAAESQWRRQVEAAGQGWQLLTPETHQEQLDQARASLGAWWAARNQDGTHQAQRAWRNARPPAWSDYDPELQRMMRTQAASFSGWYQARNEAMQREDTIRAAEQGDTAAAAQLREWVGPDVPERKIISTAREHSAEMLRQAQRAATTQTRTGQGSTTTAAAVTPTRPITPGQDQHRRPRRGR